MMTTDSRGLYIHIPFCRSKCPYCDFYSISVNREDDYDMFAMYAGTILERINRIKIMNPRLLPVSSIYFGGGTPSRLRPKVFANIIKHIDRTDNCEITLECNPYDLATSWTQQELSSLADVGLNRISMGMQSIVESERKALGRRANAEQVKKAIHLVHTSGIENLSLDLMLGIPNQTVDSIRKSIDFCAESGAKHVSSYMLKIEPGTPFHKIEQQLDLPNEDECCELYLATCELLDDYGYKQYEISNFAKPGYESRHNLLYWDCREYIGLGPSAHSFIDGKRSYYERNLIKFINGAQPIYDGEGGSFEEYVMLRLRLTEGLQNSLVRERFGFDIPQAMFEKAKTFAKNGLAVVDSEKISLTPQGFLVSNSIIAKLLD